MKKVSILFLLSVSVVFTSAQAQSTIKISGTRFTFPLFKKWADEYSKIHPGVNIIVSSAIPVDSVDIFIASHILKPGDVKEEQESIALSRYVQLPVVNSKRVDLKTLTTKGFTEASFRQIYFTGAGSGLSDFSSPFTVYKRQKAACSSVSFANHFGNEHKDIKGIPVPGDDQDLLESVKKDSNAISHNSLGIIYNIKTRKVNDSIAIIPIDLNENGTVDANEKIYSTVDEVLAFVEKTSHSKIPTENVNVIFSKTKHRQVVTDFLTWIITDGQQFNHAFGQLNLKLDTIQAQQKLLTSSSTLKACTPSLTQLKSRTTFLNNNN
jgi:phosphate transport system substrate-binding protein